MNLYDTIHTIGTRTSHRVCLFDTCNAYVLSKYVHLLPRRMRTRHTHDSAALHPRLEIVRKPFATDAALFVAESIGFNQVVPRFAATRAAVLQGKLDGGRVGDLHGRCMKRCMVHVVKNIALWNAPCFRECLCAAANTTTVSRNRPSLYIRPSRY